MPKLTATEFSSVRDKERFIAKFKSFARGGFRLSAFPKTFYRRLSNCFGFIAHYDRNGFYFERFSTRTRRMITLKHMAEWSCHGDPAYTFSDVERVIGAWITEQATAPGGMDIGTDHEYHDRESGIMGPKVNKSLFRRAR